MENEALVTIQSDIDAGNLDEARTALKPLLREADGTPPPEVLYLLGRTFFEQDRATARYLFEAALAQKPDYQEAGQYEARCGSSLEDLEDFSDHRHPPCGACGLHYRDHEPYCPYCGASVDPPRESAAGGAFEEHLKEAGKDIIDAWKEISERDEVKAAREKISAAGKQAYVKAKEFGESEQAQELKATAKAIGVVAARKAKEIGSRKEVQTVKEKASALGQEAAEKAKAFSEREDVKEAVEKAGKTSKNFLMKSAAYAGAEVRRINEAQGAMKGLLIGKWVIIVLVVLYVINWIFGD